MAGGNNLITFNFDSASHLGSQLKKQTSELNATLSEVEIYVAKVDGWWKGESCNTFKSRFKQSKTKTSNQLEAWLRSYDELLKKVEQTKREQEKRRSGKISNF
ncbi:MAG: hypothetical protein FWD34_01250 [Oscillospiraceae bacterium]|nr:hypothetical protein [Oscillospiraceae bacterium]